MVLPRASAFGSTFRSSLYRTARFRARSQAWRTAGRRTYADSHGAQKKSSDLPWIVGSVVFTVPSAAWLWQQGPKKGDHGHGHDEHEEHEEGEEHEGSDEEIKDEGAEEGNEDAKDDGDSESKDDGDDKTKAEGDSDSKDDTEAKSDDKSDDADKSDDSESDDGKDVGTSEGKQGSDSPETPPTSDDEGPPVGHVKKGKGEQQKGATRKKTETQAEKNSASTTSGAQHPYLDDPEKSKKGEGVKETAKIHGTVDPQRNVRGPGDGQQPQNEGGDVPKDTPQGKTKDARETK